jgi:hypothetical protein
MAFPAGWPPRPAEGRRSFRFYVTGTATANFSDNAYLFIDGAGANTITPLPYVAPGSNAPVSIGTQPTGTGQDVHDANILASSGNQAVPKSMIWCQTIRLCNDDGANYLEYSFDGTNVHGKLLKSEQVLYRVRFEAGISVRGTTNAFRIEAW